ncbi:winged helix-turn-helix domain-containing protein [Bradyrhizobium genosp. A]|uniref:winged helix-turn-helix domain-containing protein n=1 Tax=Bradyrhizobium genosp. A TaxID=83626 RepID=UPI003CED043D
MRASVGFEKSHLSAHNGTVPLRFSTEDLPERERAAVWREVIGRDVVRLDLEPLSGSPLRSNVSVHVLPGLAMMHGDISDHRIARTRELIADGNTDFRLEIRLTGREQMTQRGREVVLGEGEAALVSCAEEVVALQSPGHFLGLHIARADISALVPNVDDAVMRRIPRDVPALRMLVNYVDLIRARGDLSEPELLRSMSSHICELVALTLAAPGGEPVSMRAGRWSMSRPSTRRWLSPTVAPPSKKRGALPQQSGAMLFVDDDNEGGRAAVTRDSPVDPPTAVRPGIGRRDDLQAIADHLPGLTSLSGSHCTFGPFRLDEETQTLLRDNELVALGPRAVTLLGILVKHRGIPMSKDVLVERAWSGRAVEESNLTVQIAALRRALAQGGDARWIETLPRRGYRFIGPAASWSGSGCGIPTMVARDGRLPE